MIEIPVCAMSAIDARTSSGRSSARSAATGRARSIRAGYERPPVPVRVGASPSMAVHSALRRHRPQSLRSAIHPDRQDVGDVAGTLRATAELMRTAPPATAAVLRRAAGAAWGALPPSGRLALLGVLASAVVAIALGLYIPLEIRRHLLDAEGRGLEAAVVALTPSLPDLSSGSLTADEIELTDQLVGRALLGSGHVPAKL